MHEERKRRLESRAFYWETTVATIWTLLIAVMLVGSAYVRLGTPLFESASHSEAAMASASSGEAGADNK